MNFYLLYCINTYKTQKFLTYIISWLLLQLSAEINCQPDFKPERRYLHTATFVGDKLYILGGYNLTFGLNEFLYLDVSSPFNTENLAWKILSTSTVVPPHYNAASAVGGTTDNIIFLYGGSPINATDAMALVYSFDTQSNTWNVSNVVGNSTTRKLALTGIVNNSGKMFLFGGVNYDGLAGSDMLILDTINLNWEQGSVINAPPRRYYYSAVLLSNQSILYMGGVGFNTILSLNKVYIYDTINDKWSEKETSGEIPPSRVGFSAVLGLSGQRIIIFGGLPNIDNNEKVASRDSLYVLDLNNFEWKFPNINGITPNSRAYHKANVIRRYMVISFGSGYDNTNESDILLLDIYNNDNYIWTYDFDPSLPSTPGPLTSPATNNMKQPDGSKNTLVLLIGVVIGSLLGCALITFGGFSLYRWNKNTHRHIQKNHTAAIDYF